MDDENATEFASEQLKPWTNLLRDLANYGSNLIPRAYSSSEKTLGDAVVIGVLLRQVVAMIDAIEILLGRSAVHASALQLRGLFEASVYLDWMLAADREKKAAYYYAYNLLRLRRWAMRVQSGTAESLSFKPMMEKAGFPVNETIANEGRRQAQEVDRVLSQDRFIAIRDAFREWKKQNGRQPSWYSPLGMTDLRRMAADVNKEPLYVIVYGSGSDVMHASNYGQHIRIAERRITFFSIRHPKQFPTAMQFTANIAISSFRRVLQEYREGELPRFNQKYLEKWQQTFMNFPKLEIGERDLTR